MGEVFRRPSLIAIEIAWRWLFGIPFLLVCFGQAQQILAAFPLESSGFNSIDTQNPWVAAVQLANVASYYEPHVLAVLRWLLPVAALAWVVVSGLGRSLLLRRMEARTAISPHRNDRSAGRMVGSAGSHAFGVVRFHAMGGCHAHCCGRRARSGRLFHLGHLSRPRVLHGVCARQLATVDRAAPGPAGTALRAFCPWPSLRLGRPFTGKLAEINLVLGIVKLALIVVAMVLSAAPLPFSDELGPSAMHIVWAASILFYLVANDFFQVVRLKAFVEFWRVYRGGAGNA